MLYNILDMIMILMCILFPLCHNPDEDLPPDETFIPTFDDFQLQEQCSNFIDEEKRTNFRWFFGNFSNL
jgi:hypothetical protein